MIKPVKLTNGRAWRKSGDALAHFKAMLGRYNVGQKITDPNDHADLVALVSVYDSDLAPGHGTKAGLGIEYFFKDHCGDAGYSTDCFHIHRIDDSTVDFSYIHAVRSAGKLTP